MEFDICHYVVGHQYLPHAQLKTMPGETEYILAQLSCIHIRTTLDQKFHNIK